MAISEDNPSKPEEPKKPEEPVKSEVKEEDGGVGRPETRPEYEDLREGQKMEDRYTGENWKGYHQALTV